MKGDVGMNKKTNEHMNRFKKYIRRTYKNKLCALALIILGLIFTSVSNDITVLVFLSILGVPLFFAKKNYIM